MRTDKTQTLSAEAMAELQELKNTYGESPDGRHNIETDFEAWAIRELNRHAIPTLEEDKADARKRADYDYFWATKDDGEPYDGY